ncbi:uncharacterized protein LOC119637662 [Glossina fuscipes]|uniref:Uncharacterized protein LOC119637662 n=1 Tax=Glossina fuscipes TaxID=7396 RepID=A0A9C6DKB9_9MUSC|nr:uncharacterized protein LOC119637662 [Glossina fuscipes]
MKIDLQQQLVIKINYASFLNTLDTIILTEIILCIQTKSDAEEHQAFLETYGDTAPSYLDCRVGFKDLKELIGMSMTKNGLEHQECSKTLNSKAYSTKNPAQTLKKPSNS